MQSILAKLIDRLDRVEADNDELREYAESQEQLIEQKIVQNDETKRLEELSYKVVNEREGIKLMIKEIGPFDTNDQQDRHYPAIEKLDYDN